MVLLVEHRGMSQAGPVKQSLHVQVPELQSQSPWPEHSACQLFVGHWMPWEKKYRLYSDTATTRGAPRLVWVTMAEEGPSASPSAPMSTSQWGSWDVRSRHHITGREVSPSGASDVMNIMPTLSRAAEERVTPNSTPPVPLKW